ncbi:unnamed protein product [Phytomonas sp. EM1]|nr:unnamed protein product [Phytomonas sp. EM1]|eukprot:CCW63698.1 unnamed protein product [Phytomonas sp. isolate EM1]
MRRDIASAIGVLGSQITELECRAGSLISTFSLQHCAGTPSKENIDQILEHHTYLEVWEMYRSAEKYYLDLELVLKNQRTQRRAEAREQPLPLDEKARPSFSSMGLEKISPLPVVETIDSVSSSTDMLRDDSFDRRNDSRERPHKPSIPRSVLEPSPRWRSLQPVDHPVRVRKDLPEVPSSTAVRSTWHRVGFIGERWTVVLSSKYDSIVKAFLRDIGLVHDFTFSSLDKIELDEAKGSIIIKFKVSHPATMSSKDVDHVLRTIPYDNTWGLYFEVVSLENIDVMRITFHSVGFIGSRWVQVVENNWPGFSEAFVFDASRALNVAPKSVSIINYTSSPENVIVNCHVLHLATQTKEEIDMLLDMYEFHYVWSLYDKIVDSNVSPPLSRAPTVPSDPAHTQVARYTPEPPLHNASHTEPTHVRQSFSSSGTRFPNIRNPPVGVTRNADYISNTSPSTEKKGVALPIIPQAQKHQTSSTDPRHQEHHRLSGSKDHEATTKGGAFCVRPGFQPGRILSAQKQRVNLRELREAICRKRRARLQVKRKDLTHKGADSLEKVCGVNVSPIPQKAKRDIPLSSNSKSKQHAARFPPIFH